MTNYHGARSLHILRDIRANGNAQCQWRAAATTEYCMYYRKPAICISKVQLYVRVHGTCARRSHQKYGVKIGTPKTSEYVVEV